MMKIRRIAVATLALATLACGAGSAGAQPHAKATSGMEAGAQADLGLDHKAGIKMRFNKENTTGWGLMTSAERKAHREKMFAAKTYEECKAVQAEHHALMEARAKEKGKVLSQPRQTGCDQLQAHGKFK